MRRGVVRRARRRRELKVPSRPEDPAGLVQRAVARASSTSSSCSRRPLATNALLQRTGGPTKLFTTAGFEDVLEIGATDASFAVRARAGEAPHRCSAVEDRHGVDERIGMDGVVTAARRRGDRALCASSCPAGTTVAVCFLHAYRDAARTSSKLAARLRELGHVVSVSSEVAPLPREYERTSTTVVDAYVEPGACVGSSALQLARRRNCASWSRRVVHALQVRPARARCCRVRRRASWQTERLAARLGLAGRRRARHRRHLHRRGADP